MKATKYAVVLLALVLALDASNMRKVGEKDPIPEFGVADAAALEQWGGTSSFGGGMTQKLKLPDQEIYWSIRMVTSGVATSELVFWKKAKNDRLVPCLIMPVRPGAYSAFLEGVDVVVKHMGLRETDSQEVMRLKPAFFTAP